MEPLGRYFVISQASLVDSEFFDFVKTYNPLGFIIFSEHESNEQLKETISYIRSRVKRIFYFVDQEGGRVTRIKTDFDFPSAWEIGQKYSNSEIDKSFVFDLGFKVGTLLSNIGIDVNFAPCADVLTEKDNKVIGDRAYSDNSELVAILADQFASGLKKAGVIPVIKHFPGHGMVKEDSHLELPLCELEDISNFVEPFEKLFHYNFLMTAHVLYTCIDKKFPATLSESIIQNFLKKELNFQGCVITDDIKMKALNSFGSLSDISSIAFSAGCDLILFCEKNLNTVSKVIEEFSYNISRMKERIRDADLRISKVFK